MRAIDLRNCLRELSWRFLLLEIAQAIILDGLYRPLIGIARIFDLGGGLPIEVVWTNDCVYCLLMWETVDQLEVSGQLS